MGRYNNPLNEIANVSHNPYFNGMRSWGGIKTKVLSIITGHNPYFNGMRSWGKINWYQDGQPIMS